MGHVRAYQLKRLFVGSPLPTAQSPNGPNLFDGSEGGGGKAKPEIYAMGLRNPSRMTIDPVTDVPYAAWVGPDAGSPSATQGPSTYETATQLPTASWSTWGARTSR